MNNEVFKLINEQESQLKDVFSKIDANALQNSIKVLDAFHKENIMTTDFNGTTGYGFDDVGREKIEKIYADIFGAEDALVRHQIVSGTHALTICLFSLLNYGDTLLSICGTPYDTLHEVIGIKNNPSSLISHGVNYQKIDLINDDFDYEKIKDILLNNKIKVVHIQRSKGYSTRKSIGIDKLSQVIKFIKDIQKDIIIFVDNCYCEMVEELSPIMVGADICAGSLIKNLGAGIAPCGGYIVGKKEYVNLASERLFVPGEGKEVGPSLGHNKDFLQGLYLAPSVVAASLKTAALASKVLEYLGYDVEPKYNDNRADIVQNIIFKNKEDVIKFCEGIQLGSAIDSLFLPVPFKMPGYDDDIIMASGSFVSGSSIEISCDAPLREPYIAYMQGGLTYDYGKIALAYAVERILNK